MWLQKLLYHLKVHLLHKTTEGRAVAELKVWRLQQDENFPEGIKYSMFLVDLISKKTVVGFDNHKPKGYLSIFR